MRTLVIDTETTGLTKVFAELKDQPHMVEFAGVLLVDGKPHDSFSTLINPCVPMPKEATKINGITQAMLDGAPGFIAVVEKIEFLFRDVDQVIAHNADFDMNMVRFELSRIKTGFDLPPQEKIVCTVSEFFPFFGRRMKLEELYERYTGKKLEQKHRALDDVYALIEALQAARYPL